MTSKRANRYPPELRERAVRMLLEQRSEYHSELHEKVIGAFIEKYMFY
jgi:transposase-like protein